MRVRRSPVVDEAQVREAAGAVIDPELGRSLNELGTLRSVAVERGSVRVVVAAPTPDGPSADLLRGRARSAVDQIDGVRRVDVDVDVLTENERMDVARLLTSQRRSVDPVTGQHQPASRIYAVASGKGGVGKSSVTANLAVALASTGQRVGVVDADVWGYSMPQLFGVRRAPVALKGVMLPLEAHGVKLMSTGFFVDDEEPIVWRGPMLHKAIEQFLSDVHWGDLDVMLVDLPPGTGDVTLSLIELLPSAALLAVTTPQLAAQTVAARVGRMALDVRMPIAGVIENMSTVVCTGCGQQTSPFGAGGGEVLAQKLGVPLLGHIPLDVALRESGDEGVPVVRRDPDAVSSRELVRIAGSLPRPTRGLAGLSLNLTVV